jgi:hypothetical protein
MTPHHDDPIGCVRGIVWAIPASLALWCALLVLIGVAA